MKRLIGILLTCTFELFTGGNVQDSGDNSTMVLKIAEKQKIQVPEVVEPELYKQEDYDSVIAVLKEWEGYRSTAYKDSKGWAIGYGHVIKEYEKDTFPTFLDSTAAEIQLRKDLDKVVRYTHKTLELEGRELLAVSAFLFNVGTLKFSKSTLIGYIKAEHDSTSTEWLKWCHYQKGSRMVQSSHLRKRREWEIAYFNSAS
jgi:GH24 family phage-related lysozyme (muramidase)